MGLDDLVHKYMSSINEDLELFDDDYPAELAKTTLEYLSALKQKTKAKLENNFK